MNLDDYVSLPWTVHGRAERGDGAAYYLITIAELPGFSCVGDTRAEAEAEFPLVLREYLNACLESSHVPPTPSTALQSA